MPLLEVLTKMNGIKTKNYPLEFNGINTFCIEFLKYQAKDFFLRKKSSAYRSNPVLAQ